MEKSFHPSTPHLVSDLIEIGSHDDSHRRNLASLETISLIAFALRIRTWEKPSSSSSYLYIHRGVLSADRISIFLPSEILFNRLRNSNVARLEFRLVHCTSATSLHRNFSPPSPRWMRIHSPGGYLFAGLHPSRVYLSGFERWKGALSLFFKGARVLPFLDQEREGGITLFRGGDPS